MNISDIALQHWKWVKDMGWHNTTQLEKMALVCSEVGEAVDELRGERPTPKYRLELADIVLRVMDAAVDAGISLEDALIEKLEMNRVRGSSGRLR